MANTRAMKGFSNTLATGMGHNYWSLVHTRKEGGGISDGNLRFHIMESGINVESSNPCIRNEDEAIITYSWGADSASYIDERYGITHK